MSLNLTPEEQRIYDQQTHDPKLLEMWHLPKSEKGERVALALFILTIVCTYAYFIWYLTASGNAADGAGLSNLCIVVAFSAALIVLRAVQVQLLRKDTDELSTLLERNFTGDPEQDPKTHAKFLETFQFRSRKLNAAGYMLVAGMAVLAYLSLSQGGTGVSDRSLICTGAFMIFAVGYVWHMLFFNSRVIRAGFEARVRASARWQVAHPDQVAQPVTPNALPAEGEDDESWDD